MRTEYSIQYLTCTMFAWVASNLNTRSLLYYLKPFLCLNYLELYLAFSLFSRNLNANPLEVIENDAFDKLPSMQYLWVFKDEIARMWVTATTSVASVEGFFLESVIHSFHLIPCLYWNDYRQVCKVLSKRIGCRLQIPCIKCIFFEAGLISEEICITSCHEVCDWYSLPRTLWR